MLSAWVKPPECEGDHSLPCTAEVKHEWSFASLPPICLHHVDGEDFTSVALKMGVAFQNRYFLVVNIAISPLNAELNPICLLLALLRAHPILHVSRIRIKWLLVKTHLVYINLIFQLFFSLHTFSSFKHTLTQLVGKGGTSTFHSFYMFPF